ncbi:nitroreductase family protein [Clostridium luticellarii]|jgi:predicted oxidoreductase (fatty acid repression mutant protein)|uniref:Nitroreductase family protein n=1 Tax=Clostridium luticellarii TaxID=1691940 RepID=A0A2T0BN91_9CLOT|nr:nitroreductase family protein [Clostridium luticellarii]MCI1946285.1 nitroreductase family protein [Clostridium luticellarii]MCI1967403.1 nitroreductase family protein [Clostridium luticellarii]MCI1996545.1 nitroreductase family protein [Clostridium luticellarii]MCI2039814.1 nitroreductase family protein [Clostridium luticellarii]PRR85336.1 Nitroreductase family protein [Clostridium luticellarii]
MSKDFYSAVKNRRTIYGINKEKVVPEDRIIDVVQEAVKNAPSAFNSQSSRVVVLLGKNHDKLWDIVEAELKKIVPPENFSKTAEKINSFRNGYGSLLFFEDRDVVSGLQKNFPTYKDKFPLWSQQASGILQYIIWTSLEVEGLGASIQHYNPLIDEEVKKTYKIPGNWELIAQLPFGKPVSGAGEKEISPLEDRIKIFR